MLLRTIKNSSVYGKGEAWFPNPLYPQKCSPASGMTSLLVQDQHRPRDRLLPSKWPGLLVYISLFSFEYLYLIIRSIRLQGNVHTKCPDTRSNGFSQRIRCSPFRDNECIVHIDTESQVIDHELINQFLRE